MGFDVIGMELHVPQFFGRRLSFHKFFSLNSDLVLVSKNVPIVYIMESKGALYDITGDTIKQTLDLSSYSIPYGLEFLNYLINPSLSDEIFSNFINDDTLSITQQIYTSQDNIPVISFIHHFSQCAKSDNENVTSSEIFVNIFGNTVSSDHHSVAYPEHFKPFLSPENLLDAYPASSCKNKESYPLFSMNSDNLYEELSFFFNNNILANDWINIVEKNKIFEHFASNARKPLVSIDDKQSYFDDHSSFFSNDYFSSHLFDENSLFFSTDMFWASNYPDDMVCCLIHKTDDNQTCLYFVGTDDCDLSIYLDNDFFVSIENFVSLVNSKFKGIITEECIDFLKDNSNSFD